MDTFIVLISSRWVCQELGTLARALGDSVDTLDDSDSFDPVEAPVTDDEAGSSSGDDKVTRSRARRNEGGDNPFRSGGSPASDKGLDDLL